MEQTCHRCGSVLNPGAPFCAQCGAPQVRVPEAIAQSSSDVSGSGTIDGFLSSGSTSPPAATWRQILPSASAAGFAMAVASLLPYLSTFFPLWMIGGGFFAVVLYRRRVPLIQMSSAIGGKIGALAGLLGFLFFAFFISTYLMLATVVLHQGEQIRATLRGVLEQAVATNHDPRTEQVIQWMQTPDGLVLIMAFSMFLFLVAFLLLSTSGGIFGAAMARRKQR